MRWSFFRNSNYCTVLYDPIPLFFTFIELGFDDRVHIDVWCFSMVGNSVVSAIHLHH
jgi:hypothetical protein